MSFELHTLTHQPQPRLRFATPAPLPQDTPPAAPPTSQPAEPPAAPKRTHCSCGKKLDAWGWCPPCRARWDAAIRSVEKKFPRERARDL